MSDQSISIKLDKEIVYIPNYILLDEDNLLVLHMEDTDDYQKNITYIKDDTNKYFLSFKTARQNVGFSYNTIIDLLCNISRVLSGLDIEYKYEDFKKDINLYCMKYHRYREKDKLISFLDSIIELSDWKGLYDACNILFGEDLREFRHLINFTGIYCILDYLGTIYSRRNEKDTHTGNRHFRNISHSSGFYDISYLLCSKLKGYSDLYFFANCGECSQIGSTIASNLVRVASSRIFSEPHQAIVELIVNSADAYLPPNKKKVGRFGMGFFSILYFLLENPGRKLIIESVYKEKDEYKQVTLNIINDKNILKFSIYASFFYNDHKRTGTSVTIISKDRDQDRDQGQNKKIFSADDVNKFKYFKEYTKFLNGYGDIIISEESGYPNKNIKLISYKINEYRLSVRDYASGITLNQILTSLLIPSSSTKNLSSGLSNDEKDTVTTDIMATERNASHGIFAIVIKNVCIVYIKIMMFNYNLTINLPSDTVIPVTRDDIIISGKNKVYMDKAMESLKDQSLKIGSLIVLERFVELYAKKTSNVNNANYMKDKLKSIKNGLIEQKYIFMTNSQKSILSILLPNRDDNRKLISSMGYIDTEIVEGFILESLGTGSYNPNNLVHNKCLGGLIQNSYVIFIKPANLGGVFPNNTSYDRLGLMRIILVNTNHQDGINVIISNIKDNLCINDGVILQKKDNDRASSIYEEYISKYAHQDIKTTIDKITVMYSAVKDKDKYKYEHIVYDIMDTINYDYPNNHNSALRFIYLKHIVTKLVFLGLDYIIQKNGDKIEEAIFYFKSYLENTILYLPGQNLFNNRLEKLQMACISLFYYTYILKLPYLELKKVLDRIKNSRLGYSGNYATVYGQGKKIVSIPADFLVIVEKLHENIYDGSIKKLNNINEKKIRELVIKYLKDYIYKDTMLSSSTSSFVTEIRLFPESVNNIVCTSPYIINYMYYWSDYLKEDIIENELGYYVSLVTYTLINLSTYDHNNLQELGKLLDLRKHIYDINLNEKDKSRLKKIFKLFEQRYYDIYNNKIKPLGIVYINDAYLCRTVHGIIIKRSIIYLFLKSLEEVDQSNESNRRALNINIEEVSKIIEADTKLVYEKKYDFLLSNLIKNVFIKNRIDLDDIKHYEKDINLQVIPIAIDSSTSKSDSESVLIELFQNSRDAIIKSSEQNNIIKIYTSLEVRENESTFSICIKDPVGMSLNNLISMFIPFYSSKKKDDKTTGEMGTGFFNVYRGVDNVKIKTAKYGKYYEIIDEVKRDTISENVFITNDIHKIINRYSCDKNIKGTSITISYKTDANSIENIYRKITFDNTVYNIISNIPDNSVAIEYNGSDNIVKKNEDILNFAMDNISIYFKDDSPSYVYTKCVPFTNLLHFIENTFPDEALFKLLRSKYDTGIVINLGENVYEPIQSRIKIIFNEDNKKLFLKAIIKMIPRLIIKKLYMTDSTIINPVFIGEYFYGCYASDIVQVMPKPGATGELSDYFFSYEHNWYGDNGINTVKNIDILYELIGSFVKECDSAREEDKSTIYDRSMTISTNNIFKKYKVDNIVKEVKKNTGNWSEETKNKHILYKCIDIIKKWLNSKLENIYNTRERRTNEEFKINIQKNMASRQAELDQIDKVQRTNVIYFLNRYVYNYIEELKKLNMIQDNKKGPLVANDAVAPSCNIEVCEEIPGDTPPAAYYESDAKGGKIVVVYPFGINDNCINVIYNGLLSATPSAATLVREEKIDFLLCNSKSESVLCHEVEHWRNKTDHKGNPTLMHPSINSMIETNYIYQNNYMKADDTNTEIKNRNFSQFVEYISRFISLIDIINKSLQETKKFILTQNG